MPLKTSVDCYQNLAVLFLMCRFQCACHLRWQWHKIRNPLSEQWNEGYILRALPEIGRRIQNHNWQMALYLLLCEDGNGESDVLTVWFLHNEVSEMMISASDNMFVSENQEASRVRVIMADKDFMEHEAFSGAFPDANTHICFFHTLCMFHCEINAEKLAITAAQHDKCLEFLQRLTYCLSDQQYMTIYNDFILAVSTPVLQYSNRKWHDICTNGTLILEILQTIA